MNKKTLSVLLILCMLLTMVPVTALAEDIAGAEPVAAAIGETDVASINGVGFANLQAAITTSSAATIIKLEKDITEDVTIPSGKTITLDLNGKTLNLSDKGMDVLGNLTVKDSGTNGTLLNSGKGKIAIDGGIFTLESGLVSCPSDYGLYALNGGTITVSGGEITAKYAAIAGNNTTGDMNFNINGGELTAQEGPAIYMPGQVSLNITDGILNGGVSLRMGQVNITGGKILNNNSEKNTDTIAQYYNYSGNVFYPDALVINAGTYTSENTTYRNSLKLNITGGTIESSLGHGVAVYVNGKASQNISVNISGDANLSGKTDSEAIFVGQVKDIVRDGYDADYQKVTNNANVELTGGTYSSKPAAAFVKAGLGIIANDNGTYTVGEVKATDVKEDVAVAESTVEVTDSTLTDEQKTAVKNAVATVTETTTNTLTDTAKTVEVSNDTKLEAAKKLAEADITVADKPVTVVISPYFNIQVKDYNAATTATESLLQLDITPMYVLKATTAEKPEDMVEAKQDETEKNVNTVTLGNPQPLNVKDAVIISLNLPEDFTANVVKHQKDAAEGGAVYYYDLTTGTDNKASFTVTHGFSEFTLMTVENNTATINFNQNVGKKEYKITNVNDALPTVSGNFIGWKINGTTYTTLTEELWNAIAGTTVDAVAQFSSSGSSSGGSSSGGGAAIANKVTVTTPDSDVNVSHSAVSSSVINDVKDAVADDKNVQVVGGSSNTVNITAKQDGNTLTSFDNPLTVTVPVSSNVLANVKDTSKLTLAQVTKDANGEIVLTYVGGNYNADKKTFTAYVDEPGNYVLLADADVQKIELQIGDKASTVNGRTVMNDVAPIIVNDRTMIPLRFVSEALGAQVDWNEAARTVTIKQDGVTMRMTIDKMIDGFNAAPIIRNSRTMVPVRYIAEKLGANVIYVPITQEIIVVR